MMELLLLWGLTLLALAMGTAPIYLALTEAAPIRWLYWHYHLRKPVLWGISLLSVGLVLGLPGMADGFLSAGVPLSLQVVSILLGYQLHQESVFDAVDFPSFTEDLESSPVEDDTEVALVEVDGDLRAYPLPYVAHHHIVNDRFGENILSLTYCAMCRTVILFDVTELGPLFVASFKNANMVVADRRTKTFFQQATCQSVIGPLHPETLESYPFQIMTWEQARRLETPLRIVEVTERDLRDFSLPIPGIWERILRSEVTPGLSAASRDDRFAARTRVIGIKHRESKWVYLKEEVLESGVVIGPDGKFFLVGNESTVVGYETSVDGERVEPMFEPESRMIRDARTGREWDLSGVPRGGLSASSLTPLDLSDEYWFSWSFFHPDSNLVRVRSNEANSRAVGAGR